MKFPSLIGHRGLAGVAPENTLTGLRKAAEMGLSMVEVDLKLTIEGRVILFHDDTVDRTTDGFGPVREMDLDEISSLDAGYSFSKDFAGEAIPTLEEAIDLLEALNLQINLEIKPCPGRDKETARIAMSLAQDCWPRDLTPPLITSFSQDALLVARGVAPDWPFGLLADRLPKDWKTQAKAINAVSVNLNQAYLTKKKVGEIKDEGLAVLAWTVNSPDRANELYGWGVDAVFTDNPALTTPAPTEDG